MRPVVDPDMGLLQTLEFLRRLSKEDSAEMTIGAVVTTFEEMVDHDSCRFCKEPISRVISMNDLPWVHNDYPSYSRGCRVASWRPGAGWNETLDRKWRATPE